MEEIPGRPVMDGGMAEDEGKPSKEQPSNRLCLETSACLRARRVSRRRLKIPSPARIGTKSRYALYERSRSSADG